MGIKNSKQSVNISTIPKKDAKKAKVGETGDASKEPDDDLKGESIKTLEDEVFGGKENESSSLDVEAEDEQPAKDANGHAVPVLKVEDVDAEEETSKPIMSKVANMKRDLSFGRLQKMFSREAKSESQQEVKEAEPSTANVPASDGEEMKSEELKGEDIESRVTGLKKSLMKMFARESESGDGAAETSAATPASEKEGEEEIGDKKDEEEGSPTKISSLKKRLSFKAMRSKFTKEKKEADADEDADEDANEETKETDADENVGEDANEDKEGEKKENLEEKVETVEPKQDGEAPAHVDTEVNHDEGEAEVVTPSSPTEAPSVVDEELKHRGTDAQAEESHSEEPHTREGGQMELETSGTESSKGE